LGCQIIENFFHGQVAVGVAVHLKEFLKWPAAVFPLIKAYLSVVVFVQRLKPIGFAVGK
jgi:hypothetical protein